MKNTPKTVDEGNKLTEKSPSIDDTYLYSEIINEFLKQINPSPYEGQYYSAVDCYRLVNLVIKSIKNK